MSRKLILSSLLGVLVLGLTCYLKPWKRSARTMRNDQGVGPSHVAGVPRGESRADQAPDEPGSVAGRLTGSINPG